MVSRESLAKAAGELAGHLRIVDDIKALQEGQKALADALKVLGDRITDLQVELRVLKAETKLDAIRETQQIVNAVQGGLNERLEKISNRLAVLDSNLGRRETAALPGPDA